MTDPTLTERIDAALAEVAELYHRLVIVTGPLGSGKTEALDTIAERHGTRRIDLGTELSATLLSLTERQRQLRGSRLVDELVDAAATALVVLDNIEILFDGSLHLAPLACLQNLARHRTILAAWPGELTTSDGGTPFLVWGQPGHPHYDRVAAEGVTIVAAMV